MFYYVFVVGALILTSMAIFGTYTMTKEETDKAISAKSIMNNVESVEKIKKSKELYGVKLNSIYELDLPISTFVIKDDLDTNTINDLNKLQIKIKDFVSKYPTQKITCDSLLSKSSITNDEYTTCKNINLQNLNWIEDNENGLKYSVTNADISKKIGTNFGTNESDSNKIYSQDAFLFKNYSNQNVRDEKINQLIEDSKKYKEKKDYLTVSKILNKLKFFSQTKAAYENELLLKDINSGDIIITDTNLKNIIIKNTLIIMYDSNNQLIIDKTIYPNTTYFLDKNKDKIEKIISSTNFADKTLTNESYNNYLKTNSVLTSDLNISTQN